MSRKKDMLDSLLPEVRRINEEVIKLTYDDSIDSVRVKFCTGYQRKIKITGMTAEEIFEAIRHYLTN